MWWTRFFSGYNLTWNIFLLQAAVLSLCSCVNSILSLKLPEVHWNSSNPMFKTSNNDHIVEVNLGDELNFVCPYYPEAVAADMGDHEYYIVHRVSKREYEDCNIDPTNSPLAIINCNKPQIRLFFTLSFSPFLPTPNAPEFKSGGTYYFITTSTGDSTGLQNNYKGACYHRNMKLTIKVCCSTSTVCPESEAPGCCSCPTDNSTTTTTETHTPPPPQYTSASTVVTPTPPNMTRTSRKPAPTAVPTSPNTATSTRIPSHTTRVRQKSTTLENNNKPKTLGTTDSNSVEGHTSTSKPYNDNYVSSAVTNHCHISVLFYWGLSLLSTLSTVKSFLLR